MTFILKTPLVGASSGAVAGSSVALASGPWRWVSVPPVLPEPSVFPGGAQQCGAGDKTPPAMSETKAFAQL